LTVHVDGHSQVLVNRKRRRVTQVNVITQLDVRIRSNKKDEKKIKKYKERAEA
jgi:hypothetical protein